MRFLSEKGKKHLKITAVSVLAVVVCCVILFAALGVKDAFLADFEDGAHDFDTKSYVSGGSVFFQSLDGGRDGSSCLVIESESENDARFIRDLYLQSRRTYIVTAYVKVPQTVTGENAVGASVQIKGISNGTETTTDKSSYVKFTGDGWQKIQFTMKETKSYDYQLVLRLGDNGGDTAGTVYFDDITVRLVSPLTAGTYEDMKIVSCIIAIAALFIFYVGYRFAKGYELDKMGKSLLEQPAGGRMKFLYAIIVMFAVALFLRIFLSVMYFQCDVDVNLFKSWANNSLSAGFVDTYEKLGSNIDYPPLYVYFLYAAAGINELFGGVFGLGQDYFFTVLIKLPSVLCDLGIGLVILNYLKKRGASQEMCVLLTSVWLFNPLSLIDAACWGQVDSMLALLVILCAVYLNKNNYLAAGIMFGLGMMLKPQMLFFLPVIGAIWLKDVIIVKKALVALKNFGLAVGGALIGVAVPYIPFMHMGFKEIEIFGKMVNLPWIFSLYLGTVDHYEYATVNCYNFWFLLGKNWVKDEELMGGFSLYTWGMIAIVVISLATVFFAICLKKGDHVPFLLGSFMYAAVPFFAPRMHERYFFPAVALLIIAAVIYNSKSLLATSGIMSVSGFLSVSDVMMGLLVGANLKKLDDDSYGSYYWPKLDNYRGLLACLMLFSIILLFAFLIMKSIGDKLSFFGNDTLFAEGQDKITPAQTVAAETKIKRGKKK